jgi:type IV secretory pathway VirD2 relaxase
LMTDMEKDLGTNLDWVAVDHFNTGHFHTHIVIRGKDDRGKDLIIARDYITHGIRERASQLLTLELGPEDDFAKTLKLVRQIDPDIERKLRQLGQRDDIQKTMYRAMREAGIDQPAGDFAIFKTNEPNTNVIGKVAAIGLTDTIKDSHYLVIDGIDGRVHEADVQHLPHHVEPLAERFPVDLVCRVSGSINGLDVHYCPGCEPYVSSS